MSDSAKTADPIKIRDLVRDLGNLEGFRPPTPLEIPTTRRAGYNNPAHYIPDEGLVNAVRVALMLRKPLLLTGEPGTGKTDLAAYLSWKLGYRDETDETDETESGSQPNAGKKDTDRVAKPFVFESKSTSEGRHLFYQFNALGLFQAVQTQTGSKDPRDYITFNALGDAILRAYAPEDPLMKKLYSGTPPHRKASQSVVLIDEIDKAPRDFPNDVLNELERMYFRIPELENLRVEAPQGMEPVVIITSNSEKSLPPAFLRRCIFYNIEFPEKRLEQIVSGRIEEFRNNKAPLFESALSFFRHCRKPETALEKPPATGELLDWLLALILDEAKLSASLTAQREKLEQTLGALLKEPEDLKRGKEIVDQWTEPPKPASATA